MTNDGDAARMDLEKDAWHQDEAGNYYIDCPECGSAQYRLAPDVATVACPACDRPNEADDRTCWACGASLDHHRVIR